MCSRAACLLQPPSLGLRKATALLGGEVRVWHSPCAPPRLQEAIALLDDEVDGLRRRSWEHEVGGDGEDEEGVLARARDASDPDAAALALLQQLRGNTQKFRMIKRTPRCADALHDHFHVSMRSGQHDHFWVSMGSDPLDHEK